MTDITSLPDRFWHCCVAIASGRKVPQEAVVNDIPLDELRRQIVIPWHESRIFTISGVIINDKKKVESIRIYHTPEPYKHYANIHDAKMQASEICDLATDRRYLPFEKGTDYTHELLFSTLTEPLPEADAALILRLCQRLPYAARILFNRSRRGKTLYKIEDEYDAQDLLHAIIRGYMKYSVQEEPVGKVAGVKSSRADIAIEELGIIVELKYVYGPDNKGRLLDDFSKDLVLYAQWPHLRTLIYLIYNSGDLKDPEAFEKLSGRKEISGRVFQTHVVLA